MVDRADPVISKNIQSTEYIYGVTSKHFDNMKFYEAISERLLLATKLAKKLLDDQLEGKGNYQEIEQRLNSIYKAIKFNEQLLAERRREGD
jgi:hypothetical protein